MIFCYAVDLGQFYNFYGNTILICISDASNNDWDTFIDGSSGTGT